MATAVGCHGRAKTVCCVLSFRTDLKRAEPV